MGVGSNKTSNSDTVKTATNSTMLSGSFIKHTVRPLHSDMESAGVFGAIKRVQQRMRLNHGFLWDMHLRRIPEWVLNPDFEASIFKCSVIEALSVLGDVNTVIVALETNCNTPVMHTKPMPDAERIPTQVELTATVRLQYGHMLETYCRFEALEICKTSEMPTSTSEQEMFSTICYDSYLVSLWTQSHAEYMFLLDDTLFILDHVRQTQDEAKSNREDKITEASMPPPDLYNVTCMANAPDLTSLYERHTSPKTCSKTASGMLTLMMRATNTGSRGWETMLDSVLKDSDQGMAVSKWCSHLLTSAFTGLHPCIHPDMRQSWRQRLVISRVSPVYSRLQDLRDMAGAVPTAFKEVIRLYLATLFAEDAATLAASVATHQSEGQLEIPPNATSPTSLQAAMHSIASAGSSFIEKPPTSGKEISQRISSRISVEARSRKKNITRPSGKIVGVTIPLTYSSSWMGGRTGSSTSNHPLALTIMSNMTQSAFRGEFVPMWIHAQTYNHRQSRLSQSQYTALHTENAMHKLTRLLDDSEVLKIVRIAMKTPNATLMTIRQVIDLLELKQEEGGQSSAEPTSMAASALPVADCINPTNRGIQEAESAILSLTPLSAANIITFSKCVALRTHIMAYDLGKTTRKLQIDAIWKRMARGYSQIPNDEEVVKHLPKHATHAFVCTECRRIVNACVDGSAKHSGFNEIGLSASMLRIDGEVQNGHLRCAKRSSAALRTAVSLEDIANGAEIECKECNPIKTKDLRSQSISSAMEETSNNSTASSEVTKLRRDVKSCFEQNPCATACGDVPLVYIPLLGRSIRIYNDWYCLCAYCGALFKTTPLSRFRGEPCCSKCDYSTVFSPEKEKELLSMRKKPVQPSCRYCGKPEPETCVNKWKIVQAPLDSCGKNALIPPPLRVCYYCPSHFRSWVPMAHRTLTTPIILCHIGERAKPMFGANENGRTRQADDEDTQSIQKVIRKRKPRKTTHSQRTRKDPVPAKGRRKRSLVSINDD